MKILLFIDSLGAGGAQRQLVGLAKMLKERDFNVEVLVYHDIPFYKSQLEDVNIPVSIISGSVIRRIGNFFKFVKKYKPDWVISYLESPSIIASIIKPLLNYKLIVSERNTTQNFDRATRLRFEIFRLADYVVPNAYSQGQFLSVNAPYLKQKIITINNFVDTEFFKPGIKHCIRNNMQEIVIAASIWPPKNTLRFIDAVEILAKKNNRFHISWYGKIPRHLEYINECLSVINNKGLSQYITLIDKTQEIREKYQNADIFCLPSLYEGTPNVIAEAMACGLPIICSDVCDNGLYVQNNVNGFLFDPLNPESIAQSIEQCLELSDNEYQEFCKKSRSLAEELFSPQNFIDKYTSLIERN